MSDSPTRKPADVSVPPAGSAEKTPFPAWRRYLAGVFDLGPDGGDRAVEFASRAATRCFLAATSAPAHRLTRSSETIASGHADGFAIRLQLAGDMSGRMGDREVEIRAGDLVFIDLLQTLDLETKALAARDICLWVARPQILAAFGRDDVLHGLVVSGASAAGATIAAGLRVLAERARDLPAQDMDALCDGLIAFAAKSLGPTLAAPRAAVISPAAAFVTIRRYIDRNLRSAALDPEKLAETFGVSRASLYRLFEPVGGVASYIRRARLNRAYQEIVAGDRSSRRIGAVAFSLGFKNVSAFNRAFRDFYGVSPREARERAHAATPSPPPARPEGADPTQNLGFWLAQIAAPAPSSSGRKK